MIRLFHLNNLYCLNVSTNYAILIFRRVPLFCTDEMTSFFINFILCFFFSGIPAFVTKHFSDILIFWINSFLHRMFSSHLHFQQHQQRRSDSPWNLLRLRTLTSNNTTLHDQYADTRSVDTTWPKVCRHMFNIHHWTVPILLATMCSDALF